MMNYRFKGTLYPKPLYGKWMLTWMKLRKLHSLQVVNKHHRREYMKCATPCRMDKKQILRRNLRGLYGKSCVY